MKTIKLSILSLAVFVLAATIYSCSKQEQTKPITTEISQSDADILMENKIRAFKGKMEFLRENPSYKNGESMSVDSAVWYFKAALNYTYARAGVDFNYLNSDSAAINVSTPNDEIAENDLPDIYQQILDSVRAIYNTAEGNGKTLLMVNVVPSDASASSTDLTIYAATGSTTPTYIYGYFDETDYWNWGLELGKCGEYAGQYVGQDATTVLQYHINHPSVVYPPGTYFIPDENPTRWKHYNDYPDVNSPGGYRLFYAYDEQPWTYPICIPPEDMEYYLYDG
ncbi:MAG: hypothetical protein EOM59_21880, partial [Clostridia bacterium]|nr:hypothetical protein [Clostridia bacterium]